MKAILERLRKACIFSIHRKGYCFVIGEECDQYYEIELTKEELIQLSDEIRDLANEHNIV